MFVNAKETLFKQSTKFFVIFFIITSILPCVRRVKSLQFAYVSYQKSALRLDKDNHRAKPRVGMSYCLFARWAPLYLLKPFLS